MNLDPAAVLFDLDGVLTPTAVVHTRAWKKAFDRFLDSRRLPHFTQVDYLRHVDGKPRYDGVRDFLTSRGITLPEGAPTDRPGFDTVQALGNLKNEMFTATLAEDGVEPYPDAVALLDDLTERSIAMAVVSSSANATDVLDAAGLASRFAVVVDGKVARAAGLGGKPAPDTFLHAAELLGTDATDTAVVEDAISGVEAGKTGGFGLVVGVARHGDDGDLRQAGADLVVGRLDDLIDRLGHR